MTLSPSPFTFVPPAFPDNPTFLAAACRELQNVSRYPHERSSFAVLFDHFTYVELAHRLIVDPERTLQQEAVGWWGLGRQQLQPEDEVVVEGARYKKQDCYIKSILADPNFSYAWNNLGTTLRVKYETVTILGKAYSKLECYCEALRCDMKNGAAWNNVAAECACVTIGSRVYTALECVTEGLRFEPMCSVLWATLGRTLRNGATVEVGFETVDSRQCTLRALKYDPSCAYAWHNLAIDLKSATSRTSHPLPDEQVVVVNGASMNSRQCLIEALKTSRVNQCGFIY